MSRPWTSKYLLGPDVLVAPVVTEGATEVDVLLPPGCWTDVHTGRTYRGTRTATLPAPIDQHPYFFRCGTRPFEPPR